MYVFISILFKLIQYLIKFLIRSSVGGQTGKTGKKTVNEIKIVNHVS